MTLPQPNKATPLEEMLRKIKIKTQYRYEREQLSPEDNTGASELLTASEFIELTHSSSASIDYHRAMVSSIRSLNDSTNISINDYKAAGLEILNLIQSIYVQDPALSAIDVRNLNKAHTHLLDIVNKREALKSSLEQKLKTRAQRIKTSLTDALIKDKNPLLRGIGRYIQRSAEKKVLEQETQRQSKLAATRAINDATQNLNLVAAPEIAVPESPEVSVPEVSASEVAAPESSKTVTPESPERLSGSATITLLKEQAETLKNIEKILLDQYQTDKEQYRLDNENVARMREISTSSSSGSVALNPAISEDNATSPERQPSSADTGVFKNAAILAALGAGAYVGIEPNVLLRTVGQAGYNAMGVSNEQSNQFLPNPTTGEKIQTGAVLRTPAALQQTFKQIVARRTPPAPTPLRLVVGNNPTLLPQASWWSKAGNGALKWAANNSVLKWAGRGGSGISTLLEGAGAYNAYKEMIRARDKNNGQFNTEVMLRGLQMVSHGLGTIPLQAAAIPFIGTAAAGIGLAGSLAGMGLDYYMDKNYANSAAGAPSESTSESPQRQSLSNAEMNYNREYVAKKLKDAGYSDLQVKAILVNLQDESNFNPTALGDPDKKTGELTARGLAQWRLDRRDAMEQWEKAYAKQGRSSLEAQTDFLIAELKQYNLSPSQLSEDGATAAKTILNDYEKAGKDMVDMRSRKYENDPQLKSPSSGVRIISIERPQSGGQPQAFNTPRNNGFDRLNNTFTPSATRNSQQILSDSGMTGSPTNIAMVTNNIVNNNSTVVPASNQSPIIPIPINARTENIYAYLYANVV